MTPESRTLGALSCLRAACAGSLPPSTWNGRALATARTVEGHFAVTVPGENWGGVITAGPFTKLFACVWKGIVEDMCYERLETLLETRGRVPLGAGNTGELETRGHHPKPRPFESA